MEVLSMCHVNNANGFLDAAACKKLRVVVRPKKVTGGMVVRLKSGRWSVQTIMGVHPKSVMYSDETEQAQYMYGNVREVSHTFPYIYCNLLLSPRAFLPVLRMLYSASAKSQRTLPLHPQQRVGWGYWC